MNVIMLHPADQFSGKHTKTGMSVSGLAQSNFPKVQYRGAMTWRVLPELINRAIQGRDLGKLSHGRMTHPSPSIVAFMVQFAAQMNPIRLSSYEEPTSTAFEELDMIQTIVTIMYNSRSWLKRVARINSNLLGAGKNNHLTRGEIDRGKKGANCSDLFICIQLWRFSAELRQVPRLLSEASDAQVSEDRPQLHSALCRPHKYSSTERCVNPINTDPQSELSQTHVSSSNRDVVMKYCRPPLAL
ncbi:hypothetical protein J6590_047022 [Homalodisca vitripennis]|nr:hypothetical protein J6590_047022 [Homalodisca vitripennis]